MELAQKMKKDLLEGLERLAEYLPPNTLDELIDELGGPENVAEVLRMWLQRTCVVVSMFLKLGWFSICVSTVLLHHCASDDGP